MTIPRVFLVFILAALMSGCESDSTRAPVYIDPGHVQIRRGQEQEFVATGGYDYAWSIENRSMGTLTRTPENHRVIYTAISAPEEGTSIQVLRVVSKVEGASKGETNRQGVASYSVQAEAHIVHLADPEEPPPSDSEDLAISPAGVEMGIDASPQAFSVTGGRPGYTWSLSDPTLGTLNASGSSAVYTRGPNAGSLFVVVRDASGKQVEASVIQTGDQVPNNTANGGNANGNGNGNAGNGDNGIPPIPS